MTKKIAIIGGGVVGATAAFYLTKNQNYEVALFDEATGQGTSASAGIISPWLSKRRNKEWYQMVKLGAAFYPEMLDEVLAGADIPNEIYQRVGTILFTKKDKQLEDLLEIGKKRREHAPEIGALKILSPTEIKELLPIYTKEKCALFAAGGARVDGKELVTLLIQTAINNGLQFIQERAQLKQNTNEKYIVQSSSITETYDAVILANAAWLPETLAPLGFEVDIRPQKGQMVELQTSWETNAWPVVMPTGEKDIIPFLNGKILIGATHEDEAGYDLELEKNILEEMVENARKQFSSLISLTDIQNGRVGTRAYTSDYAPFFGEVPQLPNVFTASGLGSTGLTSGPLVGKILSDLIMENKPALDPEKYPVQNYISPKD